MKPVPNPKLRHYFATGLLMIGPVFLTLLVVIYLFRLTDRFIVNPVFEILPLDLDQTAKVLAAKLAIAAVVVAFIVFIGFLAERFIFRRVMGWFDFLLANIPFFNRIYLAIKEIAQAFFGDKSGVFKRVVFVEYPRKGIWAIAFVTSDRRWEIDRRIGREMLTVFVPSPPNPATGFFIFVPKDEAIEAEMSVEEAIKLVISVGAALPAPRKS